MFLYLFQGLEEEDEIAMFCLQTKGSFMDKYVSFFCMHTQIALISNGGVYCNHLWEKDKGLLILV